MPSNPPNVVCVFADQWRAQDAGYAGASAELLQEEGLADNTLFVFTSDHGDMLGSQGEVKKQWPWEESVRVPFLLRWPQRFGWQGRQVDALLQRKLDQRGDAFLPGAAYIEEWGYPLDETGTVPYEW